MKKVLLSLFAAIVCLPMAFGQIDAGHVIKTYDKTACGSFTWDITGEVYTSDTAVAVTIGDTIHILDLTFDTAKVDTATAIELAGVCGVKWRDSIFTTPGSFIYTQHLNNGCDSIVKLNITLTETAGATFDTIDTVACNQYIAPWGDTLTVSCDSTHIAFNNNTFCAASTTVHLTIKPVYLTPFDTVDVTGGCSYTFGGVTYTDSNVVHTTTMKSVDGCDSVAAIRIIAYTGTQNVDLNVEGCGQYKWNLNNVTYTEAGTYTHVAANADSSCITTTTLNLTFGDRYDTTYVAKCAEHTQRYTNRNGIQNYAFTVTESGIYTTDTNYTDTIFPDANLYSYDILTHCYTHHTLIATIVQPNQIVHDDIDTSACNTFSYRLSSTARVTLTDNADTTLVYKRHNDTIASQCFDESVRIIFHIRRTSYHNDTVSTCDSYTWPFNGKTYDHSLTAIDTVKQTTIEVSDTIITTDTITGEIDTTFVYDTIISNMLNEAGCDSLGRLRLTINPSPEMTIEGEWMLEPGQQTTLKAVCANITSGLRYQWYKDGVAVAGNEGKRDSLVVEAPGTMSENNNVEIRLVTTTNRNCSSENWITITSNDMGIEGIESVDVDIYPNPAARIVNLSSSETLSEVVIFNAIGQTVISKSINGTHSQLDLGNLANGTYTLRITAANGEQTTRKLIVNK